MLNFIVRKLIKIFHPAIRVLGDWHMPFSRKYVSGEDYYRLLSVCQPGDILFSTTRGEISNFMTPGVWKHGAILGFAEDGLLVKKFVIEAVGSGVRKKNLASWFFRKDYVCLLRHKKADGKQVVKQAEKLIGTSYDYFVSLDNTTLYCFEACYLAILRAIGKRPFQPTIKLGEAVVVADSFLDSGQFEVVFVSEKGRRFFIG